MGKAPTVEERLTKLRSTASEYGLTLEAIGYSSHTARQTRVIKFTKSDTGQEKTLHGLWIAEIFLKGYVFAHIGDPDPTVMGKWMQKFDPLPASDPDILVKFVGIEEE